MPFKMKKKGMIQNLQPLVIALVAISLVIAVGFIIQAQMEDQVANQNPCVNSSQYWHTGLKACCNDSTCTTGANSSRSIAMNSSLETMNAMSSVPGWIPIVIVAVIGTLLIGMIGFFGTRR